MAAQPLFTSRDGASHRSLASRLCLPSNPTQSKGKRVSESVPVLPEADVSRPNGCQHFVRQEAPAHMQMSGSNLYSQASTLY